jgi:hypothetical protein
MSARHFACAVVLAGFSLMPLACSRDAKDTWPRTTGTTGAEVGLEDRAADSRNSAAASSVRARLAAESIGTRHPIEVKADNGVVTLKGEVDTKAEFEQAGLLARQTEGVRHVINELKVKEDLQHPGDHHKDETPEAGAGHLPPKER